MINITSVTGQYDGNFTTLTPANSIIFVGDTVSLNGGPYYTVQQVFSNGNIQVANNSFGPINNALITVNKSATYNYDNTLSPAAFSQLPGATPTPNPIDSKDFYVLFPRETILPDHTQYKH